MGWRGGNREKSSFFTIPDLSQNRNFEERTKGENRKQKRMTGRLSTNRTRLTAQETQHCIRQGKCHVSVNQVEYIHETGQKLVYMDDGKKLSGEHKTACQQKHWPHTPHKS